MDDYKELNEILVRLFRSIMDVEEKAIITREFQDITNNDMHVIEAIGIVCSSCKIPQRDDHIHHG